MDFDLFHAKVSRKFNTWVSPGREKADLEKLKQHNAQSDRSVLDAAGPVVSLTTHGERTQLVYLTIESIGRGQVKPSRLILWLDDERQMHNLPGTLKRLQARGVEILLTRNLGPHTKYFPYVESIDQHRVPLVTADDDIVYPPYWLSGLAAGYKSHPEHINCFRAHVVSVKADGTIAPYADWTPCESRAASFQHFATGVSGVIYPPPFLDKLKQASTAFLACAKRADDVWLHAIALREGYKIRQIVRIAKHFPIILGTQDQALMHTNNFDGGNDAQIKTTYSPHDVDRMLST